MLEIDNEEDDGDRQFDQEAESWFSRKKQAEERKLAAALRHPMPDAGTVAAQQRLRAAQEAKAAQVTPGSLSGEAVDPFGFPTGIKASIPVNIESPPSDTTSAPTNVLANVRPKDVMITFWTAIEKRNNSQNKETRTIYADIWDSLKGKLKDQLEGEWVATEYTFKCTAANLLGFFVPSQHAAPVDVQQATFEVIVANGKVFKAES